MGVAARGLDVGMSRLSAKNAGDAAPSPTRSSRKRLGAVVGNRWKTICFDAEGDLAGVRNQFMGTRALSWSDARETAKRLARKRRQLAFRATRIATRVNLGNRILPR